MTNIVEVSSVKKKFKGTGSVLKSIDLQVESSQVVGLLGPNGSGKTTLLNIMVDLLKSDRGQVTFWNSKFVDLEALIAKVGVMLSPQWVDERLSVEEFLMSQLILIKSNKPDRENIKKSILKTVGLEGSEKNVYLNFRWG